MIFVVGGAFRVKPLLVHVLIHALFYVFDQNPIQSELFAWYIITFHLRIDRKHQIFNVILPSSQERCFKDTN